MTNNFLPHFAGAQCKQKLVAKYATQESKAPLLDGKAKRFIQQVCGK
jgi:hypothetical protein